MRVTQRSRPSPAQISTPSRFSRIARPVIAGRPAATAPPAAGNVNDGNDGNEEGMSPGRPVGGARRENASLSPWISLALDEVHATAAQGPLRVLSGPMVTLGPVAGGGLSVLRARSSLVAVLLAECELGGDRGSGRVVMELG
jgi:hypothetical protein